jgi:hypothetical protein
LQAAARTGRPRQSAAIARNNGEIDATTIPAMMVKSGIAGVFDQAAKAASGADAAL